MSLKSLRIMMAALVGFVSLALSASEAQGQAAVITGRVSSQQGNPLSAAQVQITELNLSVGTDPEGRYVITIPSARVENQSVVLRVRAIGYTPQTRPITVRTGTQTLDFTLTQDVNRLAEVVVTGVTVGMEQGKIPFKVDRLAAADMPVPQSDPLMQIQGKVPGATLVAASGRPGQSPSIILRAPTSINGTGRGQGPLILVDGVQTQSGVAEINSEDIESVEVIKGAAGASLYGAYAGRGVINIKTRSGRGTAEGVRFHVRTEYGKNDIEGEVGIAKSHALLLDETGQLFCVGGANVRDCNRRINWENETRRINTLDPGVLITLPPASFPIDPSGSVPASILSHTFIANPYPGPTVNPSRDFIDPNDQYSAQVDMSGRWGGTSAYTSVNRTRVGGSLPTLNGMERSAARINVDQHIGDKWTGLFRLYYAHQTEDASSFESGGSLGVGSPFFRITRQNRKSDIFARDTLGRLYARTALIASGSQNLNPVHLMSVERTDNVVNRFLGSGELRWSPLTWLDVRGNFAYDAASSRYFTLIDKNELRAASTQTCAIGCAWAGSADARSYNTGVNATGTWTFGELTTRSTLNYGFLQQEFTDEDLHGRQLAVAGLSTLSSALQQATKTVGTSSNTIRGIGYYLSQSLDFRDRYIFDGLIRRDGNSTFGSEQRWKTFGRAAVAWRVSQEPWWFAPELIDDFKLRFSRGSAGGRPQFSAQYETYTLGAGGVAPFTFGNKLLRPEVTTESEYGVDVQVLGRYGLSLTRATSETKDQILLVPLPAGAGFAQQWQNAGTLEGRSWEAALTVPIITRGNVNWSSRFTYDRTRATISELFVPEFTYGPNLQATTAMFNARVGEQLGTFYGKYFLRNCAELPGAFATDCGAPGSSFQINDDGYVVWVGAGNSWTEGITKNLWGTGLYCPPADPVLGAAVGTARCNTTPYRYPVFWGMPIVMRDSLGAALQRPIGSALPKYKWTASSNFSWRGFTLYGLLDASYGRSVWNQGRHWSYLESINLDQDQAGKSVETAKPLSYYWRAAPPDGVGLGGFYDVLGPNNQTTDDASFIKLRELSVGYDFGRIGLGMGDWRVNVIGRNLKTWTDYRGWDPEVGSLAGAPAGVNSAGSGVLNAVDAFGFPNLRSVTFSLSTTF